MKAIIVAAGRSSRLYPLTLETPKTLLEIGGKSLIERSIKSLNAYGIDDILVVIGFWQQKIKKSVGYKARYILNPFFAETNNMASLWFAMPYLDGEDFIYMHSDVIFHQLLLNNLIQDKSSADISLLVDFGITDEEAMKVRCKDDSFIESSKSIPLNESVGEWTGIGRINSSAAKSLFSSIESILLERRFQDYDTAAFNILASQGLSFKLLPTDGLPWLEIDTREDLEKAKSLFDETRHES